MPDHKAQALAVEAVAEMLGISDEWQAVLDVQPGTVLSVEQVQYLVRVTHVRSYLETMDRYVLGVEAKVPLADAARMAEAARRESEQQPPLPEPVEPADQERAAAFLAAVRNCIYDKHPSGCSFGGMTVGSLYWLIAEGCALPHSEACAWCGAEPTTGFAGWEPDHHGDDNHRFLVPACGPCAEEWVRIDPRWR